jgi:hypothetical protein
MSVPTLEAVYEAYLSNAGYDHGGGSIEQAESFIVACRQLLVLMPKRSAHSNRAEEIEIDPQVIASERDKAVQWLQVNRNSLSGQVTSLSFSNFRGQGANVVGNYPSTYPFQG